MKTLKNIAVLFLTVTFFFINAQKSDDSYFDKLDDELHAAGNNKILLEKIIYREREKYEKDNEKKYFLSYKYANLFRYENRDIQLLSDNYEIFIKNDNEYRYLTIVNCYNIAYLLEFQSPELSMQFIDKGISTIGKDENNEFLPHFYHYKGYLYSLKDDYENAIKYYRLTYDIFRKRNDKFYMASLHNNIAVIYAQQKKFKESLAELQKAMPLLSNLKQDKNVQNLINEYKINLGDIYNKLYDYNNAKLNLEASLNYFEKKPSENIDKIIRITKYLPYTYEKTNKKNKIAHLIDIAKSFEKEKLTTEQNIKIDEFLLNQYLKEKNFKEIEIYHTKLTELYKKNQEEERQINQKTSRILSNKTVELIDNKYKYENESNRKKINWLTITILLGASFLVLFLFYQKNKMKQNRLNLENQKKINEQNKTIIEQNLFIQEEKIKYLRINLNLKNKIEKSFLEKIKVMRKTQKNADEILKELYFNLHNLLEIDKKNINLTETDHPHNLQYIEKLKEKFPILTNKDIELCTYLNLELSSKEIAILENTTDDYIRLRKTKLKSKLGLSKEDNLDDFLKNFI